MRKHNTRAIMTTLLALVAMLMVQQAWAEVYNVRKFGAKGDGKHVDSPAINKAIEAASKAGGGMVYIPAGEYLSYSIHMRSHVELHLEQGCTITAGPDSLFDAAEEGPNPQYQDFGHSHFQNSLIWGIGLQDISITGRGRIDGSNLSGGFGGKRVPNGIGNKAISLKECRDVAIRDITVLRGGHFVLLATGVENLILDGVTVDTNRDGFDIDCCRNVRISNCNVNSPHDDGIVLKASYALGRYADTRDVTITNCHISGYDVGTMLDGTYQKPGPISPHSGKARATRSGGRIKMGTETSGGFKNIAVTNCTFELCGGLLIESVDGGLVEDIVVSNLTMRDCIDSPIYLRLGARMRSPKGKEIGQLRRVLISDINAYNCDPRWGMEITGLPEHPVEDITLRNIHLNFQGGLSPDKAMKYLAEKATAYPDPWIFSGDKPMPCKGAFLRHIKRMNVDGLHFSYNQPDSRPLMIQVDIEDLKTRDITNR